ncbi:MAG: dephospho-CoA kinase [Bradymonadaceae bacterium]
MSTKELPAIVGLTGGIASGKTTVSRIFSDLGAVIIDADLLAREVVQPGRPALEEIRQAFGDAVVTSDGSLDRPALGTIIFSDAEARARLEAITHPRIAEAMIEAARSAAGEGRTWVIYDAALIVEKGHHHWLAALIVVACSKETQIERLMARDGLDREEAEARLRAQMPLEDKTAVADYVIENEGSIEATRRQVEDLYHLINSRF